jgi:hypothetical protein
MKRSPFSGRLRHSVAEFCDLVTRTLPKYPKSELDICEIAVIVLTDERGHFLRPSKASRLRVGARSLAIVSDRFSTGR